MNYLHWDEKTITDFSEKSVADMYAHGYVFTRIGRGVVHQTRSVRIDLSKFELSSENRRILKKMTGMKIETRSLPLLTHEYDWKIGKLAKDFYDTKFGPGIMSAQKIKEIISDEARSNFNLLLTYSNTTGPCGWTICYSDSFCSFLHYSYPFYDLSTAPKDMGLGMMILAIEHAKSSGVKYIYLGSLQRPSDTYKLQFSGLEWYDGSSWQTDLDMVKKLLK